MNPKAPTPLRFLLALIVLLFLASDVRAQQPIHGEAAVTPSAGHALVRQQVKYMTLGRDPTGYERDVRTFIASTDIAYGLTSRFALTAYIPVVWQSVDSPLIFIEELFPPGSGGGGHGHGGHDPNLPIPEGVTIHPSGSEWGLDEIVVGFKWRLYEHDFGPIDTFRVALLGALETPTGEEAFSSDSWDPSIGLAATYIEGRHGANASLNWKFNTSDIHGHHVRAGMGPDDTLFYNASWLYRLTPAAYTSNTKAATYFILEGNGIYETNGDHEILIAPGFMVEAKHTAIEFSVQLPALQEMDHRPKTDFTITLGIRFLF